MAYKCVDIKLRATCDCGTSWDVKYGEIAKFMSGGCETCEYPSAEIKCPSCKGVCEL